MYEKSKTQKGNDLPKSAQLVNGRTRIQTQESASRACDIHFLNWKADAPNFHGAETRVVGKCQQCKDLGAEYFTQLAKDYTAFPLVVP